uniref:hypothetical protein n=1 Tax=Turicimonas muris TaxID=1796652 RepID=UPI00402AE1AE
MSIGTRAPLLKMEDLRQIAFPLPSADEITQEKEKFEQQVKLLKEIRRKTKEIQELNMDSRTFFCPQIYLSSSALFS